MKRTPNYLFTATAFFPSIYCARGEREMDICMFFHSELNYYRWSNGKWTKNSLFYRLRQRSRFKFMNESKSANRHYDSVFQVNTGWNTVQSTCRPVVPVFNPGILCFLFTFPHIIQSIGRRLCNHLPNVQFLLHVNSGIAVQCGLNDSLSYFTAANTNYQATTCVLGHYNELLHILTFNTDWDIYYKYLFHN